MRRAPKRRRALARARLARELHQALAQAGPCQRGQTLDYFLRFYNLGLIARAAYKALGPIKSTYSLYRWLRRYTPDPRKPSNPGRGGRA